MIDDTKHMSRADFLKVTGTVVLGVFLFKLLGTKKVVARAMTPSGKSKVATGSSYGGGGYGR